mmetsp:Transcript_142360/g.396710  ORF Transcript_142360/g.396710 Transcript_142360/m.396710 type:complete len:225 (+) Transcript_142360:1068-1742(+)
MSFHACSPSCIARCCSNSRHRRATMITSACGRLLSLGASQCEARGQPASEPQLTPGLPGRTWLGRSIGETSGSPRTTWWPWRTAMRQPAGLRVRPNILAMRSSCSQTTVCSGTTLRGHSWPSRRPPLPRGSRMCRARIRPGCCRSLPHFRRTCPATVSWPGGCATRMRRPCGIGSRCARASTPRCCGGGCRASWPGCGPGRWRRGVVRSSRLRPGAEAAAAPQG